MLKFNIIFFLKLFITFTLKIQCISCFKMSRRLFYIFKHTVDDMK